MDAKNKPSAPQASEGKRGKWRDMPAAPRDGRSILCVTAFGDYDIASWDPVILCWVSKRGFYVDPAKWQPLPKLPTDLASTYPSRPSKDGA